MIYACNLCDDGFDNSDKIKKHIWYLHKEFVGHIFTKNEGENELKEITENKNICNEMICLETWDGKCVHICKYSDWISEKREGLPMEGETVRGTPGTTSEDSTPSKFYVMLLTCTTNRYIDRLCDSSTRVV